MRRFDRARHGAPGPRTPDDGGSLLGRLATDTVQLHLCAALVSVDTDAPGYVTDAFLATIDEDIDLAVIELCLTGLWVREGDGYRIPVRELQRVVATLHDLLADCQ